MKRLGQQDLLRQMLRIEWAEPVQFLNHFRSDSLRLAILRPAMHGAMPGRSHCVMPAAFLDPQSIRMPTASVWSGAVTDREKLSAWFKPFTRKVASGNPIRSIPPCRIRRSESAASNSANLMLDEPPLIVRMRGLAGFTDDTSGITIRTTPVPR